jgi:hypothetical protein
MATKREPKDMSHQELLGLVEGLREVMYGDTEYRTEGEVETWNPDLPVSGADLIDWVTEEFRSLGLIPEPGPRNLGDTPIELEETP